MIRPTEAVGADFAIESIRLISEKEHLSDIYRETIVARAPEKVVVSAELPSRPFLDLAVGTIEQQPVTFRITAVELTQFAGRDVDFTFELSSDEAGILGYWGSPVIRNRGGMAQRGASSSARSVLMGADTEPPRGVILILADTFRRDHLQPFGYERENAPALTDLAEGGVLFADNISQATWTKVSSASILTSLYPSTHGITDMHHRIPASVTTLAEAYYDVQ